jgi:hypothetical protein
MIPIATLIDRGFPHYDYPTKVTAAAAANYIRFIQEAQRQGVHVERARPGSAYQIVPRYTNPRDPKFEVRILSSNGAVWTGKEEQTSNLIPPGAIEPKAEIESENMLSIALRIRHGRFTYFAGADLNCLTNFDRDPWRDVETPAARAAGPVTVATCNHHAYFDACGAGFVQSLQPRVWVLQSWHASHAALSALASIYSDILYGHPRDVFCLGLHPAAALVGGRFTERFKSRQGHVLIRVASGGEEYRIFVIDDSDENGRVVGGFGPYPC